MSLRRVSSRYPDTNYSWCSQLENLFDDTGFKHVWERNSANYLESFRSRIIGEHRRRLGAADLNFAKLSSSIPHYSALKSGYGTEKYLISNYPTYLVTCISQIRLNLSIIFNQGKWYNLSMFDEELCTLCGECDSFAHLFECAQLSELRSRILPPYLNLSNFDAILKLVHKNIKQHNCKSLYFFITTALRNRNP
jgi:hypothetical protein